MNFWQKLENMDRRIIYSVITLAVVLPFFFPMRLPVVVSPEVKSLYDYIENLSPTDVVFISGDYDPSTDAELGPMLDALVRHCFMKNVKVIASNVYFIEGVPLVEPKMKQLAEEYRKVYGVDYAFLGWKYGYEMLVMAMGEDFCKAWETDYYNNSLKDLPVTQNLRNYDDIDVVIDLTGTSAYMIWIDYAYAPYKVKVAAGITAVMAADAYPNLQAGQLIGMLGGLRGAAEYEQLIKHPSGGTIGMEAQNWAHMALIGFILLGNIGFYMSKRAKKKQL
jgi:hypothetical protein